MVKKPTVVALVKYQLAQRSIFGRIDMADLLSELFKGLTFNRILVGGAIFAVTFATSLAIVSYILINLPPGYFKNPDRAQFWSGRSPGIRLAGIVGKNIVGLMLLVLGIILSIPGVPGQGILTILLGIMLLDFPGKHRLEYWLVSRPKVLQGINRLRQRFGKPELVID